MWVQALPHKNWNVVFSCWTLQELLAPVFLPCCTTDRPVIKRAMAQIQKIYWGACFLKYEKYVFQLSPFSPTNLLSTIYFKLLSLTQFKDFVGLPIPSLLDPLAIRDKRVWEQCEVYINYLRSDQCADFQVNLIRPFANFETDRIKITQFCKNKQYHRCFIES